MLEATSYKDSPKFPKGHIPRSMGEERCTAMSKICTKQKEKHFYSLPVHKFLTMTGAFTYILNSSVYSLRLAQTSQLFNPWYLLQCCKAAPLGFKPHGAFPFHLWPAAQSHAAGAVSGMSPSHKSLVTEHRDNGVLFGCTLLSLTDCIPNETVSQSVRQKNSMYVLSFKKKLKIAGQ